MPHTELRASSSRQAKRTSGVDLFAHGREGVDDDTLDDVQSDDVHQHEEHQVIEEFTYVLSRTVRWIHLQSVVADAASVSEPEVGEVEQAVPESSADLRVFAARLIGLQQIPVVGEGEEAVAVHDDDC